MNEFKFLLFIIISGYRLKKHANWCKLRSEMPVTTTSDFKVADTYVVQDVTNPGQRVTWQAMFKPSLVVSLQAVLRGGDGPWIKHNPNFTTSHFVFITESFQREHSHLADLVRSTLRRRRPGDLVMRWCLENDLGSWQGKLASRTGQRFPKHCLALVTESEKRSRQWKHIPGAMTSRSFATWRYPKSIEHSYLAQAQL